MRGPQPVRPLRLKKLAEVRAAAQALANELGQPVEIVGRARRILNHPPRIWTVETVAPAAAIEPAPRMKEWKLSDLRKRSAAGLTGANLFK